MQLTKSVTLPSGVSANYWNITYTGIDPIAQNVQITLNLFLDRASYDAGLLPITSKMVNISMAGLTTLPSVQAEMAPLIMAAL